MATSIISPLYRDFQQCAARLPDKIALIIDDQRWTYQALSVEVDALYEGLVQCKLQPSDHVGILLPNCFEFVLLLLAGARLGLVLVPQSMALPPQAIETSFCNADVRHLVVWGGVSAHLSNTTLALAQQGTRITVGTTASAGWTTFDVVRQSGTHAASRALLIEPAQDYLLLMTSGSTGQPKPIILSQQTKQLRIQSAVELYGVTDHDVTMAATPLYHSLAQRLVLLPLTTGGTSVLLAHFTPALWMNAAACHRVSFTIAVSSQLKQILGLLKATSTPLPAMRCIVSSSALLDEETKRQLVAQLHCDFHECYGASEIAFGTNLSPDAGEHKLGSVGVAIPGACIGVVDEQGRPVPTGMAGEIVCSTPMRFTGYYKQPRVTEAAYVDGCFRTGDLGRLDEDGFLYFLGRIKDIVISGGINVYPQDIEDVVASLGFVRECAVIALPDERLGEVIGLVYALSAGAPADAQREIQRACMARLADFQQPRKLFLVDELPRNAMGKLDRPRLRATYAQPH